MPLTYPPASPTQVGEITQIHQLLNSPTMLDRRLRTIAENRFISSVLLTGRYPVEAGAIAYQQGESIFTARDVEAIRPGMEYPRTGLGFGPQQIAEVVKWGSDVPITDEAVRRLRMDPVNRALLKLVNTLVRKVDGIALAAIASQVTATHAAAALWSAGTATILRDLLLAVSKVTALNQGFMPDTVVVDDTTYAMVVSDKTIQEARSREDGANPVYTGSFPMIAGLRILPSPNVPFANSALVLDSTQLGGMADEQLGGPNYSGGLGGIETKTIRDEDKDGWRIRARRVTVPIVVEPAAAIRITGVS